MHLHRCQTCVHYHLSFLVFLILSAVNWRHITEHSAFILYIYIYISFLRPLFQLIVCQCLEFEYIATNMGITKTCTGILYQPGSSEDKGLMWKAFLQFLSDPSSAQGTRKVDVTKMEKQTHTSLSVTFRIKVINRQYPVDVITCFIEAVGIIEVISSHTGICDEPRHVLCTVFMVTKSEDDSAHVAGPAVPVQTQQYYYLGRPHFDANLETFC